MSQKMGWKDGSPEKIALHGLVSALAAKEGGGNLLAGAASGAGSELLNTYVTDYLKAHTELSSAQRNAIQSLTAMGTGALIGKAVGGNEQSTNLGMNLARLAEENNRQLHPDEKQRIEELANQLSKEKGGDPKFWQEQLTLVGSAMVDDKESQQIISGLEAIFSQSPEFFPRKVDREKTKEGIIIAYHTLVNEAHKNQPIKWKDGSEIVLFNEKVKMFNTTDKQYKNNKMFGYMDSPLFNHYPITPNTTAITLDDLGKLNGLNSDTMKYRNELFNILGTSHKTKQDNLGLLSSKYSSYYMGDRVDPVFWETFVMGRGAVNGVNKAIGVTMNTGEYLSTQAGSYLGNFANKYPNISGATVDGIYSTGAYMGYKISINKEINSYELGAAFASGALTRNHSLSNQIRINVGIATVSSLSKDPSGRSLGEDYFGATVSPIIGNPFGNMKYGNIVGGVLGEVGGDLDNIKVLDKKVEEIKIRFKGENNE